MNFEDHELLSLPFIEEVFRNDKYGYIRFRIVGTEYGFDYRVKREDCSGIFKFRKNGRNFSGRKGPVDFQTVMDTIPEEYIGFLVFCKDVFSYK